jgi:hypothetical protein
MTARRSHGEGGLYWNEKRQRWIATVTVGMTDGASGSSRPDQAGPRPKRSANSVSSCATTRTDSPSAATTTPCARRSKTG